jgi:pyroglutamyl-peptidase
MKILVAGLKSAGAEGLHPAVEVAKMLPIVVGEAFIVKLEVPAFFIRSIDTVIKAIDEHLPDAVICVAQAGGRFGLTPEFVALNYINASAPDEAGNRPQNKVVIPGGPTAYITNLPISGMVSAIKESGIPAEISYTAGTSLGNSLMYGVLHHVESRRLETLAGMVQIPYIPSQTVLLGRDEPSMSIDDIKSGLEAAIGITSIYIGQKQRAYEEAAVPDAVQDYRVDYNIPSFDYRR